jgi:Secretion system C-terminal sorting domain
MKNIHILIIILFAFCAKVAVAQNLAFSYSVTNTGNTSKVKIFTQNTSSTSEVLASFNAYFYYNNAETTLVNWDNTPLTALGWAPDFATTYVAANNPTVTTVHTGRSEYNVYDGNLTGAVIPANSVPILLLEINFNHTVGTPTGDFGYLASTVLNAHPPLTYSSLSTQFPILVTGLAAQPLPLELVQFEATTRQNAIQLNWVSDTEINFDGYEIQRSEDGTEYQSIGFVKGKGGNKTTPYSLLDSDVKPGILYYYRLKMIDLSKLWQFSKVVSASIQSIVKDPVIVPNPASERCSLHIESSVEKSAVIYLMDATGKLISTQTVELRPQMNSIPLEIKQLPTGIYPVRVAMGEQYNWSGNIIKNN